MKYKFKYDKDRDLAQVVPGLSIQIKEAVETGAIKDTGYIPDYNDITDPNHVIGRIRDNFEAVEAMKHVQKFGQKQAPTQPTPTQTPSSAMTPTNE